MRPSEFYFIFLQDSLQVLLRALLCMKTNSIIVCIFTSTQLSPRSGKVTFCFGNPFFSERLHRELFPFE